MPGACVQCPVARWPPDRQPPEVGAACVNDRILVKNNAHCPEHGELVFLVVLAAGSIALKPLSRRTGHKLSCASLCGLDPVVVRARAMASESAVRTRRTEREHRCRLHAL